jgi:hypothetical protein
MLHIARPVTYTRSAVIDDGAAGIVAAIDRTIIAVSIIGIADAT